MTHLGLFEGIGGFSLAVKWAGGKTLAWCEWNEFGQKVLKYHFPEAEGYGDITKTDFRKYANKIDILTGGFPCQPFSMAGKRKGTDDERYLWHEMLRAIQEVKPRFVIAENVFGITNIDGGLVFEQVCADLENEGYEVQAFIIPACSKNAPHRRDRVWFVANRNNRNGQKERFQARREVNMDWIKGKRITTNTKGKRGKRFTLQKKKKNAKHGITCSNGITTNANSDGLDKRNSNNEKHASQRGQYAQRNAEQSNGNGNATNATSSRRGEDNWQRKSRFNDKTSSTNDWQNFPTQSPICSGDDGLSTELDGITFQKWRAESIKAYGNAIVPQVAYELIKQLFFPIL